MAADAVRCSRWCVDQRHAAVGEGSLYSMMTAWPAREEGSSTCASAAVQAAPPQPQGPAVACVQMLCCTNATVPQTVGYHNPQQPTWLAKLGTVMPSPRSLSTLSLAACRGQSANRLVKGIDMQVSLQRMPSPRSLSTLSLAACMEQMATVHLACTLAAWHGGSALDGYWAAEQKHSTQGPCIGTRPHHEDRAGGGAIIRGLLVAEGQAFGADGATRAHQLQPGACMGHWEKDRLKSETFQQWKGRLMEPPGHTSFSRVLAVYGTRWTKAKLRISGYAPFAALAAPRHSVANTHLPL